ncbi:hypothetical protein DERP_011262 [Dermatophagoides pteronyssinus]|uniref:Uncharacterized protein n=1 Tax=Dermatophagoides pteronyssinus TaxID=6956 RepID=A0ABQ8JCM2_DERPT|nr:hypothetical protein DERP_011262 [Dermatophagoides pteronyssinus]
MICILEFLVVNVYNNIIYLYIPYLFIYLFMEINKQQQQQKGSSSLSVNNKLEWFFTFFLFLSNKNFEPKIFKHQIFTYWKIFFRSFRFGEWNFETSTEYSSCRLFQ